MYLGVPWQCVCVFTVAGRLTGWFDDARDVSLDVCSLLRSSHPVACGVAVESHGRGLRSSTPAVLGLICLARQTVTLLVSFCACMEVPPFQGRLSSSTNAPRLLKYVFKALCPCRTVFGLRKRWLVSDRHACSTCAAGLVLLFAGSCVASEHSGWGSAEEAASATCLCCPASPLLLPSCGRAFKGE